MIRKIYEVAVQGSLYLVVGLAYAYCLIDFGVPMV
jgi:hypothetical protein